jgi:hypothetical protein
MVRTRVLNMLSSAIQDCQVRKECGDVDRSNERDLFTLVQRVLHNKRACVKNECDGDGRVEMNEGSEVVGEERRGDKLYAKDSIAVC